MKTFQLSYEHADTCGNTWTEAKDPVQHFQAEHIRKVWEKLNSPDIFQYTTVDGKTLQRVRTPKGQGYGIWENNPDFDFNRELNADNVKAFETGGFYSMIVEEIETQRID